jgi:hypothetical protein
MIHLGIDQRLRKEHRALLFEAVEDFGVAIRAQMIPVKAPLPIPRKLSLPRRRRILQHGEEQSFQAHWGRHHDADAMFPKPCGRNVMGRYIRIE